MSGRRALVTGISGQDGSYLAERLLDAGDEVVGVARAPLTREMALIEHLRDRLTLVEGDLADPARLRRVIEDVRPDDIFHLGAPTFVPASWDDPGAVVRQVTEASAAVLQAAETIGARVLVASSPEIFGNADESPQTEATPPHPRNPYGIAKLAAHELVSVMRETRGVHASAAITYNHESPRRPERFVTRKITRAAAAISLGLETSVTLGDLDARRDWSHAADIVAGMVLALRHDDPGDYILASGTARTVREFAVDAFAAVGLDASEHVRVDPDLVRPPEPRPLVGDPARAHDVLGWQPQIRFGDLVREMVEADLERLRSV